MWAMLSFALLVMPAENAPTPIAKNIYPSCDTVEYANTFFMSFCVTPTVAAKNAVKAPRIVITVNAVGANSNNGEHLISKNTPAVTIVAA